MSGGDPLDRMRNRAHARQTVDVDPVTWIEIDKLHMDGELQIRIHGVNQQRAQQYAEVMLAHGGWGPFPRIEAAEDEHDLDYFWVGDGNHRMAGAHIYNDIRRGMVERGDVDDGRYITHVPVLVIPGGYDGARERAESANLIHGLDITSDDKFRVYLRHRDRGEWDWNNRESTITTRDIAAVMGVSHTTISRWESRREKMLKKLGAPAPTAEEYARTKIAGSRKSAPKQPPTKLQRKQRVLRDLKSVIAELRELGEGAQATGYEKDMDDLLAKWDLD